MTAATGLRRSSAGEIAMLLHRIVAVATVRTHRKLRRAGVEADLQVFEGLSHAQYTINPDAPETREAFEEIGRFFDRHMQR
jgi:acetyl esterase/lipase